MNEQMLSRIDRAMTEIDLLLYEWQTGLDMMSFIGYDVTFEMWTNDDPPRMVTSDVWSQAAGKELRIMHHVDGEWTQVGTAEVGPDGIAKGTLTRDIPELTHHNLGMFSIGIGGGWRPLPARRREDEPMAHFNIDANGKVTQNVYRKMRLPDEMIEDLDLPNNKGYPGIEGLLEDPALENHPFFNKEN